MASAQGGVKSPILAGHTPIRIAQLTDLILGTGVVEEVGAYGISCEGTSEDLERATILDVGEARALTVDDVEEEGLHLYSLAPVRVSLSGVSSVAVCVLINGTDGTPIVIAALSVVNVAGKVFVLHLLEGITISVVGLAGETRCVGRVTLVLLEADLVGEQIGALGRTTLDGTHSLGDRDDLVFVLHHEVVQSTAT